GVSISSDGPVYSVVLAHRGEISDIEEIQLDPASQTAVNLLRCLLAERRLKPHLIRNIDSQSVRPADFQPADRVAAENISPWRTGKMPIFRAARCASLLIGDHAIALRQKHAGEFEFWDLGEQWRKLTGLPFVYALWLIRPEVADAKSIAQRLRELRDKNLASLDDLIEEAIAGVGLSAVALAKADDPGGPKTTEFLSRYYRKHLGFS